MSNVFWYCGSSTYSSVLDLFMEGDWSELFIGLFWGDGMTRYDYWASARLTWSTIFAWLGSKAACLKDFSIYLKVPYQANSINMAKKGAKKAAAEAPAPAPKKAT